MSQNLRTLPYRPSTRPGTTSATQTQTQIETGVPVLRLRATQDVAGSSTRARIHWADDVVDNEGMGRKKSKGRLALGSTTPRTTFQILCLSACTDCSNQKVCCIYHHPRPVGESSSESSSDSSSDSEGGEGGFDDGRARMAGEGGGRRSKRKEKREDGGVGDVPNPEHAGCEHARQTMQQTKAKASTTTGKSKSRNAYETQPKPPKGDRTVEVKS